MGNIGASLGHLAFVVADIDASLAFYENTLGMREAFRMTRDDGSLGGVYLYVAENQFLELFPAKPGADATVSETGGPDTRGGLGYSHFCLHVDDLKAALAHVKACGAPIDADVKTGVSKCRMFWTHDPDGNRVEVMELPPESLQAQATVRFISCGSTRS